MDRPAKYLSLTRLAATGSCSVKLLDCFVECQEFIGGCGSYLVGMVERNARPVSAALVGLFATGILDEDAPHGLGCRGVEMKAAIPLLSVLAAHEAQVRLVYQGGCFKGLARFFVSESLGGEPAQLVIHHGQKLLGGAGSP